MSSWHQSSFHMPRGGGRHPPRMEGSFQRGHHDTRQNWTQFFGTDGQSASQSYQRGAGPQYDDGRRGHAGGQGWTDAWRMEGWGYTEEPRPQKSRDRYHCKCCPNHPRHLAMREAQQREASDLAEGLEPMDDYEQEAPPNFRAGGNAFNGPIHHQRRYFHHRGGNSQGASLHRVSHSNIGGRRHWSSGNTGRGFMGGVIPPEVKNQLKMARDSEKRSYWQELQQNLKKSDQGWNDGVDLKSESAVGLSLDQIISQAGPSRRAANQ